MTTSEPQPDRRGEGRRETPLHFQTDAIRQMNSFYNNGFPKELAIKSSARWTSADANNLTFDKKTWDKLKTFAATRLAGTEHPPHSLILQSALEEVLSRGYGQTVQEPQSGTTQEPSKLKQAADVVFAQPEFQPAAPYTDLEQLYRDYSRIVAKYGKDAAELYWIPTRDVPPNHMTMTTLRPYSDQLSQQYSYLELIGYYLGKRHLDEHIDETKVAKDIQAFEQRFEPRVETPVQAENQEPRKYNSLAELYPMFEKLRIKVRGFERGGHDPQNKILTWVQQQQIELTPDDKRAIEQAEHGLGAAGRTNLMPIAIERLLEKKFRKVHGQRIEEEVRKRAEEYRKLDLQNKPSPQKISPEKAALRQQQAEFIERWAPVVIDRTPDGASAKQKMEIISSLIQEVIDDMPPALKQYLELKYPGDELHGYLSRSLGFRSAEIVRSKPKPPKPKWWQPWTWKRKK